jgi:glycine/D-amino acid oxidase-like deaminating enzyme
MARRDGDRPTVLPGLAPPWWLQESGILDEPDARSLEDDRDVDFAVVGGGYTGLWTALALRERDPACTVAVLERARVGEGPSGRNGGHIYGYWGSLGTLRTTLGDEAAVRLARAGDRIIPAVQAFAEQRKVDIWLRRGGAVRVSTTPAQDAKLDAAVAAAHALGAPEEAVALAREEVAQRCASPRFRRGVFFRDGATLHPARLVKALRSAVLEDEAITLYERTPVTGLDPDTRRLSTPRGTVHARAVVLAVNAAATGWRPTARRLTNFGSYIVLTEPVPELLAELGWTGDEAMTDARMFLHYFRTTADGRVLMGSGSGPIGLGGRLDGRFSTDTATASRAEAGLRHLLPALADARITHAWGGPIDVSADRLPFVGSLPGRGVHYAAGFSGNGVGPSWLAAQALASLATGGADEWTRLPLVDRRIRPLPPEPLKRIGGGVVRRAVLAVEEAEDAGRRPPRLALAAATLPRLLGLRIGLR